MSDRPGWERVKELLDQALDLPADERERFLRRATAGDTELLREIRELTASAEPAVDALERPAAHLLGEDPDLLELRDLEGAHIGPYRLTRALGSGGMGVVYEAERTGDVGGVVAVKLIKRGRDSALVERRFRRERQILARLSHPNIAHFIDGGITHDGRPYFVLERVEGIPIQTFCARHRLAVAGRVRLFLQVLDAVGFAHRNLVIHRDLKPSNILVRDDGTVKLLDFGVAKVLSDDGESDATLTQLGGRVLTPSYSSPEQIRGEPVTTATDIYSLGVVLYELLAGRPPFELDTAPIAEVQRVVSFQEPTRPSRVAAAPGRLVDGKATTVPLARGELSGDLDAILLKTLRKEPEKRYGSAMELHEDLCRFLDRRPVLARRGTPGYRAGRFLRRHRVTTTAVVTTAVVLVTGAVYGWRQNAEARRQALLAEQRVEDVRTLLNSLLFEVHDAVAELPGSTGARRLILERAHERLDDVRGSVPENPELLMSLAGAYRRLGEVQGSPTAASLGDLAAARKSFEEGLDLATRAVGADSSDLHRLRDLGLLHERLASTLAFSGEVTAGVEHSRRAQAVYERIARAFPDSARHQLTSVIGRINLSDLEGHPHFPNLGRTAVAQAGYEEALARLGSPPLRDDHSYGVRRYRGLVEERLGRMLRSRGDLEGSVERYRTSAAIRQVLHRDFPQDDDAWRDIGVTHQSLCMLARDLDRDDEALRECSLAMDVYRARFRADSLNAQTVSDLVSIHDSYQELHLANGDTLRAMGHLDLMLEWSERRLALDPGSLPGRLSHLDALLTRGLILARRAAPVPGVNETLALASELEEEGHLAPPDAARTSELRRLTGR